MPPKIKTTFTNTKGQKKIVYADGSSEFAETPQSFFQKEAGGKTGALMSQGQNTQAEGSKPFAGSSYDTLNTGLLKPQPKFDIPDAPTPTAAPGMLGEIQSNADAFTKNLQEQKNQAQVQEQNSFDALMQQLKGNVGETGLQSNLYAQRGGVDDIQKELNNINQQILSEQRSLQNKLRAIDERGGGLASGQEAEKRTAQNESLKRQADLSVIQMGVQGRYDSAKAVADRAIDAYLEQQKIDNQVFQMTYERNKNLFDKAEQREFETAQADRERQIQDQADDAKALQSAKIEAMKMARTNGAPASIISAIQSATSPEDVFDVGGQYASVDMLDRAYKAEQLKSLRTKPEALAPTDVIDQGGRKLLINTQTGEVIKDFGVSDVSVDEMQKAVMEQQVAQVDDLKAHKGLNSAVGPVGLARIGISDAFGEKDAFIGSVEQLTSGLTLESLIKAKDSGATFGALSDAELRLIEQSATKINKWAIKDDDKVVGYDVTEKDFMNELDNIANFRKLDAVLKGAEPSSVGVVQTPDGHYWAKNGDGSLTKIR